MFYVDSVINILSGTYQPLFCLLSPSYGNKKFYYAHAYLATITPILCINSSLTVSLLGAVLVWGADTSYLTSVIFTKEIWPIFSHLHGGTMA